MPGPDVRLLGEGRLERVLAILNRARRAGTRGHVARAVREAWVVLASEGGTAAEGSLEALEAALGHPAWRLAVYGTLRPGEPNANQLGGLTGTWSRGTLRGRRGRWRDFPTVTWDTGGEPIEVDVLTSRDLPQHYGRLDRFEGSAYVRELVPVETNEGVRVCNVYAAAPRGDDR